MSVQQMKDEIANTEEAIRQLEANLVVLKTKLQVAESRPVGTKFKWTKDADNYRVAVQTKKGLLQVKVVTGGQADYHENCACKRCVEIRLSNGQIPPWRRGPPLKMTLFENEFNWRDSFNEIGGKLSIISAPITKEMRQLCSAPLDAVTDALKLKELERRFPGAIFTLILTEPHRQYDIHYRRRERYFPDEIVSGDKTIFGFRELGENPALGVSLRGYYFEVTHLI